MTIDLRRVLRSVVDSAAGVLSDTAGQALESERLPPADHRPWPVPRRPWVMAQTWEHLLFAHWPVSPAALAPLVPAGLTIDTFDGSAWIGITPFRARQVRLRGLPAVPGLSDFHEINVRTYVTVDDKPGVYFFSLDADTLLGVPTARVWYLLPYFFTTALFEERGERVSATFSRAHPGAPAATFAAEYRPVRPIAHAEPDSLEWWLTERYCLYAMDGAGQIHRAEIHHAPWPLQRAEAGIHENTMAAPLGLTLTTPPALTHYARRLDVSVWSLRPVRRAGTAARRGSNRGAERRRAS
jgi:uncharacterized protein YqjF (DUF2071 family)